MQSLEKIEIITSYFKYIPVCQCIATGRWFSPGTMVSSTNKTDRHNITEILKLALNTIILIFIIITP